jgi:alpha-galactosidase
MTAWALLAAPLLIGCDLTSLDDWTLALLTNDDVLAVNQDPAGKPVAVLRPAGAGEIEVWVRELSDGSKAVGLLNPGLDPADVTIPWSDLGLSGQPEVRDVWTGQPLSSTAAGLSAPVPAHGARLIRIERPK